MRFPALRLALIGLSLSLPSMVLAAGCGSTADGFPAWMEVIKKEAAAKGISQRTIDNALGGVGYSTKVISLDRNQHSFKLSFQEFYNRRVSGAMINQGRSRIAQNSSLFSKIEERFGVPGPVLVAIWGLETNYGGYMGNLPVFPSLATLAYDCRRTDFFKNELFSALQVVDRGDMSPSQMRGAWAGEIGQTQFMASSYMKYAVDFDGNGRRDLINSSADVLASTANYLKGYGWKAGAGWAPGSHNWGVLKQWNKADVYVQTIAKMAEQIASGKPVPGGSGIRSGGDSSPGGHNFL